MSPVPKFKFNKVILLVRDPYGTLEAEFNRRVSGGNHTGYASLNSFVRPEVKHWKSFVYNKIFKWQKTNTNWFNGFPDPSTRHVVFYDELVSDTENVLKKVLEFLNVDVSEKSMKCAMDHKEGIHHRSKKRVGINLFDSSMRKTINHIKGRVYKLVKSGNKGAVHPSIHV